RALPLPPGVYASLDMRRGLSSDSFLSVLRPDGFLFDDRFVLSEVNFGNGIIVSCAYSEAVVDFFLKSPAMEPFAARRAAALHRPFEGYAQMLRAHLPPKKRAPFIALLAHSHEWSVIL